MIISDRMQVRKLIEEVNRNIERTKETVCNLLLEQKPIEGLASLKFDKTSFDPLSGEPLNFIEMLNQSFSDLVVLKAVEDLLLRYPGKEFELNMGALTGYDIYSVDNEVIAECFATVTAFNNQKIKKDSEKLTQAEKNAKKYVYFYSREDSPERIATFAEKYPEITYIRFNDFM